MVGIEGVAFRAAYDPRQAVETPSESAANDVSRREPYFGACSHLVKAVVVKRRFLLLAEGGDWWADNYFWQTNLSKPSAIESGDV